MGSGIRFFGVIVSCWILGVAGDAYTTDKTTVFCQKLHVDVAAIDSEYLQRFECIDSLKAAATVFEDAFEKSGLAVEVPKHARVLFRYRDQRLLPLIRKVAADSVAHAVYRIAAINVLGVMQDSIATAMLCTLVTSNNPLLAETALSALGKCAPKKVTQELRAVIAHEKNGYLKSTAIAALKRASGGAPVPFRRGYFEDTLGLYCMTSFLFNPRLRGNEQTSFGDKIDHIVVQPASSGGCIYPHQQYKMNPATIFNGRTYGVQFDDENPFHVGEDSGFFIEGLPIHSIADGIVTELLYEQSWGFLVTVESNLRYHGTVTVVYAHLSKYLDVEIGQRVKKGDKIGDLGPQESVENGGYYSHLHWGVVKGAHATAPIHGYSPDTGAYYDPLTFVVKENYPKGVNYRKLLFR